LLQQWLPQSLSAASAAALETDGSLQSLAGRQKALLQQWLPLPFFCYFSSCCCDCAANVGPVRNQYKCLIPIYVFPEMKLCSLLISKTEL
jgi:hypothetical protein